MPNDPAIHLSGLGQNWRPMHLIAFSEGVYEILIRFSKAGVLNEL